ncbi:lipocalin-like domain-containing protein [Dickeya ananatis]|uniref:lipocalin-like domain-containing protein n=1 Tax=Dickeya ananatis TaxID=3061286 RepID=UPI00388DC3A1
MPKEEKLQMTQILSEQLIGAWRLVSYIERPRDGSPLRQPMTDRPQGLILYTPDGYMSAQLCSPDRPRFASGDWFVASPEEFEAEATTYIAYSGPWELGEQDGTITHGMDVSLFPNWYGQRQLRRVRIEGDRLFLSSVEPVRSSGVEIDATLEWQRVTPYSKA